MCNDYIFFDPDDDLTQSKQVVLQKMDISQQYKKTL
jgi:hypothetical protein